MILTLRCEAKPSLEGEEAGLLRMRAGLEGSAGLALKAANPSRTYSLNA